LNFDKLFLKEFEKEKGKNKPASLTFRPGGPAAR
jgi:hypothetical protein